MENEATRLRLLKAAKTLFSAHGFRNVTVRALANEAGVNLSLVSYHFGGKEGLYRACLESFALERVRSNARFLEPCDSAEAFRLRLALFVGELFEIHTAEPEISSIIIQEHDEGTPLGEELFAHTFLPLIQRMEEFLRHGMERGFLPDRGDPALVTWLLFNLIGKVFANLGKGRGPYSLDDLKDKNVRETMVRHIVAMTLGGFEASK